MEQARQKLQQQVNVDSEKKKQEQIKVKLHPLF